MEFDFIDYMENVAVSSKDILHTVSNKRFFRVSGIGSIEEFLLDLHKHDGMVLMADTNRSGRIIGQTESHRNIQQYRFYLFKRGDHKDHDLNDQIREETLATALKILGKIRHDRYEDQFSGTENGLRSVDLYNVNYETVGPIGDFWIGTMVTFRNNTSAVNDGMKYDTDDWNS